jgi:hypothetical protein
MYQESAWGQSEVGAVLRPAGLGVEIGLDAVDLVLLESFQQGQAG